MMYWFRKEFRKLNWYVIGNVIGNVLLVLAVLLLFPLLCGLIYHEKIIAFVWVIIGCILCGLPLSRLKVAHAMYFARDGMMAVGLCWVVLSLVGALPFFLSGAIPDYVDAFLKRSLALLRLVQAF